MQRNKPLETIIAIMLGLMAIYWFKRWNIVLLLAIFFGVAGLTIPAAARGIHRLWMELSRALGAVSGTILLTVVYIFVLVPLSFLSRLFGKPGLRLRRGGGSYFKQRNHGYAPEDLTNPW